MMIPVLCESPRDRHPQEKCASKCIRGSVSLCLHHFSITRDGLWSRSLGVFGPWTLDSTQWAKTKTKDRKPKQKGDDPMNAPSAKEVMPMKL
jgi:hypothetical protein